MTLLKNLWISQFALGVVTAIVLTNSAVASTDKVLDLPFTWKDDQGKNVLLSQWKDHYVAITMSYTSCRKLCPMMTLKTLKDIQERWKTKGIEGELITVTFDPESDTPQVLAKYRNEKGLTDPHWHFLAGTKDATLQLSKKLGLEGFYQMDDHIVHDFRILLLSPDGKTAVLDWEHRDIEKAIP